MPVRPKRITPVKPKDKGKGKGKNSKSENEERKVESTEEGKEGGERGSVHMTRGLCKKIEDEEKKKKGGGKEIRRKKG